MGCGCCRTVANQVHPEQATSIVPCASSSTSRPPDEKAVEAPDSSRAEEEQCLATAALDPDCPQSLVAAQEQCLATAALDPDCPQSLVAAQAEPTPPPSRPKKTLIKAAKENNLALIDELLRSGAGLEDLGMWDNTPLLVACSYGHSEAAMRFIAQKANVLATNEHGATPMHYASVEGLLGVVEALLGACANEGLSESKLVNCGLAKVYNRHLDAYAQRTPLSSAAESGFAPVVNVLLAAGAVIEEVDEDGRTPLWLAARHARLDAMRSLTQHGADTNLKDSKGVSVLEAATLAGNEELVRSLLGVGVADVNDTAGSPLQHAVRSGKRGLVEALLTHGASTEVKPGAVMSPPLHAACEKGDEYLVSLLVRARADSSIRNAAGQTAFDLLRRRGLPDGQIAQMLSRSSHGGADGCTGATGETLEASII